MGESYFNEHLDDVAFRCQRRDVADHTDPLAYTGEILNPQRLDSGFTSIEDELDADDACADKELLPQRVCGDLKESSALRMTEQSCNQTGRPLPLDNIITAADAAECSGRVSSLNYRITDLISSLR